MSPEEYIAAHTSPEPEFLAALYRDTHLRHINPRMCSGHVQGVLLKILTAIAAPRHILELGTFTGYATLCMAQGMPPGCVIDTVEANDELEEELRETFSHSPRCADIHLHIGPALDVVPSLPGTWDLVFIDADKRQYPQYLEMLLTRLQPGAVILADNTLWDGHILNPETARDPQSRAIARFNDMVSENPRLLSTILPLRDGLTIIRINADENKN